MARRLREAQVYCELFPWDARTEAVMAIQPRGFILSGGPRSAYEPGAPTIQDYIIESHLPTFQSPNVISSRRRGDLDGSGIKVTSATDEFQHRGFLDLRER